MTVRILVLLVGLLLAGAARAEPTAECGAPAPRDDGWAVAAPDAVALDATLLCPVIQRLADPAVNVHSVVVVRHGSLVFEHYFAGEDQRWGRPIGKVVFGPDTRHDMRSITKAVTGLLFGIAAGQGKFPALDTPVFDYFPEYAALRTPEKARIRLRDLLTMSSGLEWDEKLPYTDPKNSENMLDVAPEPYRFVLEQKLIETPGLRFNYNSGGTTLLGAVIARQTGQRLDAYARDMLFTPLGIMDVEWARLDNGDPAGASGLRLRPRDLAKIGQLVLARGAWKGRQIVPAEWIDEATAPQIAGEALYFYGYQLWLGRSLVGRHKLDWVAGVGLGGQRVFIVPADDLVVAVTAGLYTSNQQAAIPLEILDHYVLPAVRDRPALKQ